MELTFIAKIHSFTHYAKLWREMYKNIFICQFFSSTDKSERIRIKSPDSEKPTSLQCKTLTLHSKRIQSTHLEFLILLSILKFAYRVFTSLRVNP